MLILVRFYHFFVVVLPSLSCSSPRMSCPWTNSNTPFSARRRCTKSTMSKNIFSDGLIYIFRLAYIPLIKKFIFALKKEKSNTPACRDVGRSAISSCGVEAAATHIHTTTTSTYHYQYVPLLSPWLGVPQSCYCYFRFYFCFLTVVGESHGEYMHGAFIASHHFYHPPFLLRY